MVRHDGSKVQLGQGQTLFALPSNVGPRTMPSYGSLYQQAIYDLGGGMRVFAGTVSDPFYIDLGAAFDSLNFRMAAGGGVLSASVDADDKHNYAPNAVAGYNVNSYRPGGSHNNVDGRWSTSRCERSQERSSGPTRRLLDSKLWSGAYRAGLRAMEVGSKSSGWEIPSSMS